MSLNSTRPTKPSASPAAETDRAARATYEVFIALVTAIALIVMVAYLFVPLPAVIKDVLEAIDVGICAVFLFDFFRTLARAPNKIRYLLTWGWLDFVGSLPATPWLRLLRIIRINRTLRAMHGKSIGAILLEARTRQAETTLMGTLLAGILVVSLGSILIVLIESHSPNANIVTGEDAVWWAVVTVATVGYGDYYPVTYPGRAVAVFVMIVGVSLFSVITSYLANSFQRRQRQSQDDKIAALATEIKELKQLLQERIPPVPDDTKTD
jgi:voltage-gated potassium channel